jgi:hypothetical protein
VVVTVEGTLEEGVAVAYVQTKCGFQPIWES